MNSQRDDLTSRLDERAYLVWLVEVYKQELVNENPILFRKMAQMLALSDRMYADLKDADKLCAEDMDTKTWMDLMKLKDSLIGKYQKSLGSISTYFGRVKSMADQRGRGGGASAADQFSAMKLGQIFDNQPKDEDSSNRTDSE